MFQEKFTDEKVFFTSDTHFSHGNIMHYCSRPFKDVEEMNEALITNWNNVIGKDDVVFHLGDFAMGGVQTWESILERLNGKIHLIAGNHDMQTLGKHTFSRFEEVCLQKEILIGRQQILLNHYPMLCYAGSYKSKWQLFGHVHSGPFHNGLDDVRMEHLFPRQYDVGVDNNNYTPVSYTDLKKIIDLQIASTQIKGLYQ